jgi:hypothetical protein
MNRIFVASALFFTSILSPVISTDNAEAVSWAENHREYLKQREAYMTAKKTELNIPAEAVAKSVYARDRFENILLNKEYIKSKNGEIKSPNTSVLDVVVEKITSISFVNTTYAYTFGKEDFESCGAIPCSFTAESSYGTSAMTLDATSKVNGTDSVRCDINATDSECSLYKTVTGDDEYYLQFYILIPTGFTFGASGYLSLFTTSNGTNAPVYCSLEDYGTVRVTCQGELGIPYIDTGVDISLNTPTKLEFYVKANATTGDVDVWKNNNTVGSPDFNGAGNYNTGSATITRISIGGYSPDLVNDKYYDDVIIDTAFIGAGAVEATSTVNSTVKGGVIIKGGVIMGSM